VVRIVLVREQQVGVEEVRSVFVAADVLQIDDVLGDVLVVERFGEFCSVPVTDRSVAPVGAKRGNAAEG